MNRKTIFINGKLSAFGLAFAFILGSGCIGTAQAPVAQVFLQVPHPPCIWTASYVYKKEPEPPKSPKDPRELIAFKRMQQIFPREKSKTVYVTKDISRSVIQWVQGRTTEQWISGDFVIYSSPALLDGEVTYNRIPADVDKEISPLNFQSTTVNFSELSWIKPECLVGKATFQGVAANHFVNPPPPRVRGTDASGDAQSPDVSSPTPKPGAHSPKQEAWIDARTGFPIAMEDDNVRITYKLYKETPSAAEMKMPPAYQEVWDRLKNL